MQLILTVSIFNVFKVHDKRDLRYAGRDHVVARVCLLPLLVFLLNAFHDLIEIYLGLLTLA